MNSALGNAPEEDLQLTLLNLIIINDITFKIA